MLGAIAEDTYSPPTRDLQIDVAPVLIVEDDPDVRDGLASLIEAMGLKAIVATNGYEALVLAKRERPCLIVLDLMMRVMNGWAFRDAQGQDPEIASVPVIVVTAAGDAEAEAHALGAVVGLEKPIDLETLEDVVARYCGTG